MTAFLTNLKLKRLMFKGKIEKKLLASNSKELFIYRAI